MAEDKNYEPEVVSETPFPGEPIVSDTQRESSSGGNYAPTTTKEKPFKQKRIAVELLSTALNTRSKKILQEFDLQDTGGFRVGDFKQGISGDLRITPNGLTARNIAGLTTFAIDGDTGEAFFLGTIRAGSIISESELIGGSININDKFTVDAEGNVAITEGNITIKDNTETTMIDSTGLVSTVNFTSDSATANPSTNFTTSTYVTVASSPLSFTLPRTAKILVLLTVQSSAAQTTGGSDAIGRIFFTPHLDGVAQLPEILIDSGLVNVTGERENIIRKTYSTTLLISAASGSHTLDFRYKIDSGSNITASLNNWSLTYIILGK